jgi:hypothetical protein
MIDDVDTWRAAELLDRLDNRPPDRGALCIAFLQQQVSPAGSVNRNILAVLVNQELLPWAYPGLPPHKVAA